MIKQIIYVGIGGSAGSILRYLISILSAKHFDFKFPVHTFAVNIIGSFIIGLIMGYLYKSGDSASSLRYLIAIGFCGGFTTFSSFAFENINLFSGNNTWTAIAYIFSSVLLSLLAVIGGMQLIK